MNLLQEHVANGRRFVVSNYIEGGDQVSATLTISGPPIPEPVNVTKIFTFRSGTNVVVQMNDGVDVLALRAQWAEYDEIRRGGGLVERSLVMRIHNPHNYECGCDADCWCRRTRDRPSCEVVDQAALHPVARVPARQPRTRRVEADIRRELTPRVEAASARSVTYLLRRAHLVGVRAEHAAVARKRAYLHCAGRTHPEELTGVCRHLHASRGAALGARERRDRSHGGHHATLARSCSSGRS